MQLFHCGKKTHNFGDFLNVWFGEQCRPGVLDDDPRAGPPQGTSTWRR